ncbi:Hint domain-containing protein [Acetobacter pasteurianus]|uniref:Hint domain-containing protein n=1 Tax=Acetobacter pasteurianus TaxID=438 RepID=UPI003D0A8FD9
MSISAANTTWKEVIGAYDDGKDGTTQHGNVTLDATNNAISVTNNPDTNSVAGPYTQYGADNIVSGLIIVGTNPVTFSGNGTLGMNGTLTMESGSSLTVNGMGLTSSNAPTMSSDSTLTLENGASVSLNGKIDGTVHFGDAANGEHNTLILGSGSYTVNNITNYSPSSSIEFQNAPGVEGIRWLQTGTNTYELETKVQNGTGYSYNVLVSSVSFAQAVDANGNPEVDASGNPVYYTPASLYNDGSGATGTDENGHTYYDSYGMTENDGTLSLTCFLANSMIETPEGPVAVQDLRRGDVVVVYVNGARQERALTWAGKARATVNPALADDEAGYPVRILKDAIAEGVPYKDMLITAEHCLFFDGKFIPARMLVNGTTIVYDKSVAAYDYYHIELAEHSVIMADGMLTESYLDTGNRRKFTQEGNVVSLGGRAKSWHADAAAPLCVDRAVVEPLFNHLAARKAVVANAHVAPAAPVLTTDADIRLVTDRGAVVRPMRYQGNTVCFMLPAGVQSVQIVSRASRPCDVVGPFVDDRRQMGVVVGRVVLQTAARAYTLTGHLQAEKPAGWHVSDRADCAWTNGNAELQLAEAAGAGLSMLAIEILAAGPFVVAEDKQEEQALTA